MAGLSKNHSDGDLVKYLDACRTEAENARLTRDRFTRANYDMYHLRHDFSHKKEGQSTEILSTQRMAVEATKSFFQQALADITEWYSIKIKDSSVDEEAMLIKPHEAKTLMDFQLTQSEYFSHVGMCIQRALLGSLMISKTHGKFVPKHKFVVKTKKKGLFRKKKHVVTTDDKTWQLSYSRIRNEDFFPDPTGRGNYCIEDIHTDLHTIKALSKGDDAIYSGIHLSYIIDMFTYDYKNKFNSTLKNKFILLAPYAAEIGIDAIVHNTQHINIIVEIIYGNLLQDISFIIDDYDEKYMYDHFYVEGIPTGIYFDHKIAGEFSSFPFIYKEIVKKQPSRYKIEELKNMINSSD